MEFVTVFTTFNLKLVTATNTSHYLRYPRYRNPPAISDIITPNMVPPTNDLFMFMFIVIFSPP